VPDRIYVRDRELMTSAKVTPAEFVQRAPAKM